MKPNYSRGALSLPAAIIIAGALIAIAIIWISRPPKTDTTTANTANMPSLSGPAGMKDVSADDHILGNPNAPIKLVEYSDPSCPYCKLFNPTMEQIMAKYGPTGNVAWVYRQLPLYVPDDQGNVLHPNSGTQAEAFECAAALGGNSMFFKYMNDWFTHFPTDGAERSVSQDSQQIAATAKNVGLNAVSFNECVTSHRFKSKIAQDYQDGLAAGVTGTPYTIIITPSGNKIPLSGGQDFSTLVNTIDTLLTTIPAKDTTTSNASPQTQPTTNTPKTPSNTTVSPSTASPVFY